MQATPIATAPAALLYLQAGNATLTLVSKRTGTRYTYKVQKAKDADRWFVKVLTGPNNTEDYTYIGFACHGNTRLLMAPGKKGNCQHPAYRAFAWALAQLQQDTMPAELEVWHEGRCGRCGRTLTVPESIESGIGPECAKRLH